MSRQPKPYTKLQVALANPIIRAMSVINTWIYRTSGGRIGGRFLRSGAPILLLTTVGRKSGKPRVAPLLYLRDGDTLVVVASKGGMDHHPLWYLNLRDHPDVEVEIGSEVLKMRARTADGAEKKRLWPKLCEMYPDYADYQARTQRDIPVVILERR